MKNLVLDSLLKTHEQPEQEERGDGECERPLVLDVKQKAFAAGRQRCVFFPNKGISPSEGANKILEKMQGLVRL